MSSSQQQSEKKQLTRSEVISGGCILIIAQLSASSTASCVKALPHETPPILRGLWRQTLTSFFFAVITLALAFYGRCIGDDKQITNAGFSDEETNLLPKKNTVPIGEEGTEDKSKIYKQRVGLVAIAVLGSTLLNDAIIIALQYACSATVICLCNTSRFQEVAIVCALSSQALLLNSQFHS